MEASKAMPDFGNFFAYLDAVDPELTRDSMVSLNIFHSSMQGGALPMKKLVVPRLQKLVSSIKAKSDYGEDQDLAEVFETELDAIVEDVADLPEGVGELLADKLQQRFAEAKEEELNTELPSAEAPGSEALEAPSEGEDSVLEEPPEEEPSESSFIQMHSSVILEWAKKLGAEKTMKSSKSSMVKVPVATFKKWLEATFKSALPSEDNVVVPKAVFKRWVSSLERSAIIPQKVLSGWIKELDSSAIIPGEEFNSWMKDMADSVIIRKASFSSFLDKIVEVSTNERLKEFSSSFKASMKSKSGDEFEEDIDNFVKVTLEADEPTAVKVETKGEAVVEDEDLDDTDVDGADEELSEDMTAELAAALDAEASAVTPGVSGKSATPAVSVDLDINEETIDENVSSKDAEEFIQQMESQLDKVSKNGISEIPLVKSNSSRPADRSVIQDLEDTLFN